jgi:hypothetical protein
MYGLSAALRFLDCMSLSLSLVTCSRCGYCGRTSMFAALVSTVASLASKLCLIFYASMSIMQNTTTSAALACTELPEPRH